MSIAAPPASGEYSRHHFIEHKKIKVQENQSGFITCPGNVAGRLWGVVAKCAPREAAHYNSGGSEDDDFMPQGNTCPQHPELAVRGSKAMSSQQKP